MKKFLLIIMLLLCGVCYAQKSTVSKVNDNTFTVSKSEAKSSVYTATGNYYVDAKGVKYEIYTHTCMRGENAGKTQCYIQKMSKKTGKPYWVKVDVNPKDLKK